MKITIIAVGSRGDVQPYLALALGLRRAGHAVRFATNCNFADLVTGYGLDFHPIQVDSHALVQEQNTQAWLGAGTLLGLIYHTFRVLRPTLPQILSDAWAACREAEAIVYHSYTFPAGAFFGEALSVPAIRASMYPLPTRAHPALQVDERISPGGWFNRLTHLVEEQVTWQFFRPAVQDFFAGALRVPVTGPYHRHRKEGRPTLCCYSPTVLPVPPDAPPNTHVTGYWFLPPPPAWEPNPALLGFLAEGPRPVYVGFGSMGDPAEARATTELVLDALAQAGQRAVLAAGWSGLGTEMTLPDDVFLLRSAPHTWLFPRMAAIVHHGGVGTTGAGLRAGVPNVVVPHFADQFFWGRRVAALGAGPAPIPRKELTAARLARALAAMGEGGFPGRAAAIGKKIQQEDGVGQAVALFHRFVGAPGSGAQ